MGPIVNLFNRLFRVKLSFQVKKSRKGFEMSTELEINGETPKNR